MLWNRKLNPQGVEHIKVTSSKHEIP